MSWEVVSCWIESHPGLASWVQAIGAIASIWGAFAISNSQVKQRKELEQKKAHAYKLVVKSAAEYVSALGDAIDRNIQVEQLQAAWQQTLRGFVETSLRSLKQLPVHDLGNYELVNAYNGTVGSIETLLERAKRFDSQEPFTGRQAEYLYSELRTQCLTVKILTDVFEKHSEA